jgi:hypothetical protein
MDVVFVKYVIEHYHTTGPLFTNETCSLFDTFHQFVHNTWQL